MICNLTRGMCLGYTVIKVANKKPRACIILLIILLILLVIQIQTTYFYLNRYSEPDGITAGNVHGRK